ncbi:MAG TPA: glycine betaine/L-proline ABC transporter substrate-binding protein ProX [Desulfosalsimonadaceae bacterium]|nr:glycine betaine/L-proline ABC transporter substrate-binding protein ProX [Desulfosalsimonadaceae bacterium]
MKQKTLILGTICIFLFAGCFFGCGQEEKAEQPAQETTKETVETTKEKAAETVEAALPGKGKTVTPSCATWTTGFFLEGLYSRACEELGYTVKEPKKLAAPIFYRSLAAGDLDYWANGWFPLHQEFLPNNWKDKITMAGTVVQAGAVQGYLVSKEHVQKYDIKSLDDFKRDEVKKAFDANDDGKADLVACPPGWGCEKTIAFHMDNYDLWDHINLIKAGYSASMADAIARYNDGKPVFFYTWTPNWTVYKLKPGEDVLWINVPEIIPKEGQKGFEADMVAKGLTGTVTDPCKMGFVANDIRVVANNDFLENNPAVETMFSLMSVPFSDIAAQNNKMFEGEDTQKDIERHVTEWIEKNQAKWNAWLNAAKAAAE